MTTRSLLLLALLAMGCEETFVPEPLAPEAFEPVLQTLSLQLSAAPAFGDERGGGIFVDLAGRVVRVRPNGHRGVLESHPRNDVWPGRASAVFPLGPYNALVATDRGLFVVDQGWLIAPPWRTALDPDGLTGVTLGEGGVAWLAHAEGLYRLDNGVLTEFKLGEERLAGVTALGLAPTLDGTPGVWFSREGRLFAAAQTSRSEFQVRESGLSPDTLAGGVVGLAGIAPGRDSGGELWVATAQGLLLYTGTGWRQYTLPATPRRLVASGRFAWLQAGDALYRYDGDTRRWAEVQGLAAAPTLVAIDTAGSAWVRVGSETLSVSRNAAPRVFGLHQGAHVFDGQLVLQAALPEASAASKLEWAIDDAAPTELDLSRGEAGEGPTAGFVFHSLGGVEAGGIMRPVSLASLKDGRHVLAVTATASGASATRRLHFEFFGAATAAVSWEARVRPLAEARCMGCHGLGTDLELATYEQWRDWAPAIAAAVRDLRMPPTGGITSADRQLIVRWVNGGALP